jgi:hypothetical protein
VKKDKKLFVLREIPSYGPYIFALSEWGANANVNRPMESIGGKGVEGVRETSKIPRHYIK